MRPEGQASLLADSTMTCAPDPAQQASIGRAHKPEHSGQWPAGLHAALRTQARFRDPATPTRTATFASSRWGGTGGGIFNLSPRGLTNCYLVVKTNGLTFTSLVSCR